MEDSIAVKKFKEGYNCAQSVFYQYADRAGIPTDYALKLATGFGGGMGRKQEVCGAISGGVLALSALYGRGENEEKSQQETTYRKVRQFIDLFEQENGHITCRKILDDCSLLTEEGRKRFADERKIEICYSCVNKAVQILDRLMSEA